MKKIIQFLLCASLLILIITGCTTKDKKVTSIQNNITVESQSLLNGQSSNVKNESVEANTEEKINQPVLAIEAKILLKSGDSGKEVIELQKKLYCIGYTIRVDGSFGNETSEILKTFQNTKNIISTGNYDTKTEEELKAMKATRTYNPPQTTVIKPSGEAPTGFTSIPDIKTSPGEAQQVIVILASSYGTINAALKTYEKVNGLWQLTCSGSAVTGINGFSDNRHEGDLTSPTGKYGIPFLFGIANNPGVKLTYKKVQVGDYWVSNKIISEYNVWMHYEGTDAKARLYDYESLWENPLYKYAAVIDFNYGASKVLGKGSGIFLHIAPYKGGGTLGCIGISETNLVKTLKWLDPAKKPVIIMGVKGKI
ncbi:MAG: peptidoglycan-binding protein [Clostridiaceae bacterium]|nr:peptidoglycan-binding protein [Clostridiaceae bacterium]